MSDTEEWTREDDQHIATWIARNPNTALASGVRRAVTELWKTQGRLTDLAATVAALTAENERLRALLADSDPACTADCGYPSLCFMYPNEQHAGCPRQAAALPSSRETTDG